jgi:hypothetical protein
MPNQPPPNRPQPGPPSPTQPHQPPSQPGAPQPPKPAEDPRAAKPEAAQGPVPPRWDDPAKINRLPPAPGWNVKPAIDPRAEKPPEGWRGDGMTIADEQRARSAWIEAHGMAAYEDATDHRPAEDKPVLDKNALAGGGAYISQGAQKQVPGVTPPTKRS